MKEAYCKPRNGARRRDMRVCSNCAGCEGGIRCLPVFSVVFNWRTLRPPERLDTHDRWSRRLLDWIGERKMGSDRVFPTLDGPARVCSEMDGANFAFAV